MARAFIILYVLMGISYMSVSAHEEEAKAVNVTEQETAKSSNSTELSSNTPSKTVADLSRDPSSCGWDVELSGSTSITYRIPDGVQHVSCVWVVWAKTGGPVRVRNVDNSQAQFDPSFRVTLEKNFTKNTSTLQTILKNGSEDMVYFSYPEFNFFYVFFTGKRTGKNQGVHLKLSDNGSNTIVGSPPTLRYIQLDRRSGEFKFPRDNKSTYTRFFVIGYIPEGRTHDISIKCDLETNSDFFFLSWQSEITNETSTFRNTSSKTCSRRTIPHGKSYIMAFISDEWGVRSSVRYSYSNIDDNSEWHIRETYVMPSSSGQLCLLPNFIIFFMFFWSKIYCQYKILLN